MYSRSRAINRDALSISLRLSTDFGQRGKCLRRLSAKPLVTRGLGMDNISTARKRWRPTFSLRSLILLTTLVCLFLAGWHSTVTRGVKLLGGYLGVDHNPAAIEVKAPFVMAEPLSTAINNADRTESRDDENVLPVGLRSLHQVAIYHRASAQYWPTASGPLRFHQCPARLHLGRRTLHPTNAPCPIGWKPHVAVKWPCHS